MQCQAKNRFNQILPMWIVYISTALTILWGVKWRSVNAQTLRAPQISTTSASCTTVTRKWCVCMSSLSNAPWAWSLQPYKHKTHKSYNHPKHKNGLIWYIHKASPMVVSQNLSSATSLAIFAPINTLILMPSFSRITSEISFSPSGPSSTP